MGRPSTVFDELTRTFTADRQFVDDLVLDPEGAKFLEMCVWFLWLRDYLHDIQDSLCDAGAKHGSTYQVWVSAMIGGVAQSTGMLMYLTARGVIQEAGAAARRALEYLGMASHLVRDPAKAQFLERADAASDEFEDAFIRGRSLGASERKALKDAGIRYRFSAMSPGWAKAATRLYQLFSTFNVHGGTLKSLVQVNVSPTPNSCGFHNRSVKGVADNLRLFTPVWEIVAGELTELVGMHGMRTKRINEAGACVLVWLNGQDPRWTERVNGIRAQFGLGELS